MSYVITFIALAIVVGARIAVGRLMSRGSLRRLNVKDSLWSGSFGG